MESIKIPKDLWIDNFEKIASEHFSDSMKQTNVEFIFDSTMDKIDSFAATLLFAWILHLRKKNIDVTININHQTISDRVSKILYGIKLLNTLKNYGVIVDNKYHRVELPNYPVQILEIEKIQKVTKDIKYFNKYIEEFIQTVDNDLYTTPYSRFIIQDITNIIIKEILSNSFIHSHKNVFPFLFITDRKAGTHRDSSYHYLLTKFEDGQDLLEICIGDLGSGIHSTLSKSLPSNWNSPLVDKIELTKKEKILLYAFEYSSTSNPEIRKERINALIKNQEIDINPEMVASGLYSMLGVVKNFGGQFIIKSSGKMLAFDFNNPNKELVIKGFGGTEYDLEYCSKIPGTFFKIVIPIKSEYKNNFSVVQSDIPTYREIDVIDFRSEEFYQKDESIALNYFFEKTQSIFRKNKKLYKTNGIGFVTILDVPLNNLSSKAQQILILYLLNHLRKDNYLIINSDYVPIALYDKLNLFKNNKIYVGNIHKNNYSEIGFIEEKTVSHIKTINKLFSSKENKLIVDKLAKIYESNLNEILGSEKIRLTNGPFLFEKQGYYTTIFYQVENALNFQSYLDILSQYFANYIEGNGIEIVIIESEILRPLMSEVQNKIRNHFEKNVTILLNNDHIVSQSFNHIGKKGIVLTDVICSGNNIKLFISSLTHIKIEKIFTIVDGRNEQTSLSFDIEGKHYSYLVSSFKWEFIKNLDDHPYSGQGKERIVVVDQKTKRPTIRERFKRPKEWISSLIKSIDADSLLNDHLEYRGKHYSYYIHFPIFFDYIQKDLEKWLKDEQIPILKNKIKGKGIIVCYYDDPSFNWIVRFIQQVFIQNKVEFIKVDNQILEAPNPEIKETAERCAWILALPAISSGDTQMKMIEFASRQNPFSIDLFSFVTRMDYISSNFYDGITAYRDAKFSVAYYTMFPIKSYKKDVPDCPYCSIISLTKKINYEGFDFIKELCIKKLSQLEVLNIDNFDRTKISSLITNNNQEEKENLILRTKIRALYEASLTNPNERRELKKILMEGKIPKLAFVEIVAREFTLDIFKIQNIKDSLYDIYEEILGFTKGILQSKPPFPMRNYILGVGYLTGNSVMEEFKNLLNNYSESKIDLEEIIYTMLIFNKIPYNLSDLSDIKINDAENQALIKDFLNYIKKPKGFLLETISNLEIIQKIYAKIYRSSFPMIELKNLLDKEETFSISVWPEKLARIEEAYKNWVTSHNEWKNTLENSDEVKVIDNYNEQKLVDFLSEISNSMNKLLKIAHQADLISNESYQKELILLIDQITHYGGKINKMLYDKFVVVPQRIVIRENIFEQSGLKLIRDFDYDIDKKIFITEIQLQYLVNEIIGNCIQHKKGINGSYVKVTVKNENENYVSFEFEDDIEKDYNLQGIGSVNSNVDLCKQFGAIVQYFPLENKDNIFLKKVRISILKWPRQWER
ncbi:MAG: hypothetical protein ACYCVH_10560 [Ignavibacteriaceae bacterium]